MSTLKTLVDETTNIKNELITCHTTLKNKLLISHEGAKMLDLINMLGSDLLETNIIVKESLPLTGKDGEICIISSVAYSKFKIIQFEDDKHNSNDTIFIQLSTTNNNKKLEIKNTSNTKSVVLYISSISVNGTNLISYKWDGSKWNILTSGIYSILDNGYLYNKEMFGTLVLYDNTDNGRFSEVKYDVDKIKYSIGNDSSIYSRTTVKFNKNINFSDYKKFKVHIEKYSGTGSVRAMNASGSEISKTTFEANGVFELDLANVNATGFIDFFIHSASRYYITAMYIE